MAGPWYEATGGIAINLTQTPHLGLLVGLGSDSHPFHSDQHEIELMAVSEAFT